MRFLRTNTAVLVTVGPFLDKTDGVTLKTALTITNERITLTADTDAGSAPTNILDNITGATSGTANDLNYITGNDAAMMQLELAAADVNRLGRMFLIITDAANHCPVFHEFMVLPAVIYDAMVLGTDLFDVSVTQLLGTAWLTPGTAGTPDVNAKLHGGTAQTGRDIGASVLLSAGSGAGQLDFTSGVVKSNLIQILGTVITETAGQIAAGFKKLFDVAVPVFTLLSINQTGDSFTRLGAPVGASHAADVAALQADTDNLQTRIPAALVGGRIDASVGAMAADVLTASAIATDAIGSAELAASAVTEIQAGLSTLDAAGVRTAVGLASANLDTQLTTIDDFLDTEIAAIKAKTDNLPSDPADASDVAAAFGTVNASLASISAFVDTEVGAIKAKTDNLPASPAAVGSAMTLAADSVTAAALAADAGVEIAAAILDAANGVETSLTLRQALRLLVAAEAGKLSGAATTTVVIRNYGDSKSRITATVDSDGNRSAVVYDLT